jgi:hypothetical protein
VSITSKSPPRSASSTDNVCKLSIKIKEGYKKMASLIDFILPEDQEKYRAIIERAAEAKANAPKVRKPRAPMTEEQKIKMTEARLAKLQAKLAALRANKE